MSAFNRFEVVEALAGAGKTFKLSNRYLRLIVQGADPASILATTFSVKAAGEIRDRIIQSVALAIDDESAREVLFEGVPELEKTREACVDLLRMIIADLHRLQIGTIDSFFVKTAKLFGDELGFPTSWTILDELREHKIFTLSIAKMLSGKQPEKIATALQLATGSSVVPVGSTIRSIYGYAYDLIRQAGEEVWLRAGKQKALSREEVVKAIAVLEEHGNNSEKYSKKYKASVEKAREGDWKSWIDTGLPKCMLDGTHVFAGKPISDDIIEHFQPLYDHAAAKILNLLLDKNKGVVELMMLFHDAWSSVKHAEGVYKFEDITHYLSESLVFNDVSEVAFRIDSKIDHLLVDEFQDTSMPQWNILEPLVDEIRQSDADRSLFFVGDPKQSLYGFRGGEPQLLQNLPDRLDLDGSTRLPTSWRCSPGVLALVNEVFGNASDSELLKEHSQDGLAKWMQSFTTHKSARPNSLGFAAVHTTATNESLPKPNTPCSECMVDKVAEIVRGIHEKNAAATVGILVRKNTSQQIQRIVHKLRAHPTHPVLASEHGGNPLTDSAPVTIVLSALLLADHPGHTSALFHVATSPIGESLGLAPTSNRKDAELVSATLRAKLVTNGYAKVITELAAPLFANATVRERYRLWQLIELAQSFAKEESLRPTEFVEFVKKKRIADPASSKVQVMTVHASKGLGFDAVVVCDMQESLWGTPEVLTEGKRGDVFSPPVCVSLRENAKFNSIIPHQENMWDEQTSKQIQEVLSLLYVAMTRAKYALHIVIPPRPYAVSKAKTVDRFLRQVLSLDECLPVDAVVWPPQDGPIEHANDASWFSQVEDFEPIPASKDTAFAVLQEPKHTKRVVANSSPSSLEGGGKVQIKERFAGGTNSAFDWGTLVHKWLEDIEWFDAMPTSEQLMRSALVDEAGRLGTEAVLQAAESCITAMQSEQFQATLVKPSECAKVYRELDFAVRVDKGTALAEVMLEETTDIRGTIDRLVVTKDEQGKTISAEIIDWKTDSFSDTTLDERINHYAPQLASYRIAVAGLLGIGANKIRTTLAFVSTGEVVDISDKT